MHTANDALQHLANEPGLWFHVSANPYGGWYAAFRDEGWMADELQPERGWGEGETPEQAVHAAIESFRANEDEAAR